MTRREQECHDWLMECETASEVGDAVYACFPHLCANPFDKGSRLWQAYEEDSATEAKGANRQERFAAFMEMTGPN